MKPLCYNRFILIFLLLTTTLFASLKDKSAIVYYGDNISYPMVGIHDYIIVQPAKINTDAHGFDVYKDKMYAYVSIGEIDKNIKEYKYVQKEWILTQNKAWDSDVLDLSNPQYQEFLFTKMIEPQLQRGFKNFFFDTLDSYQLAAKNAQERAKGEAALVSIINNFHKHYPDAKLVVNRGFEVIDRIHNSVNAVLFESYYNGLSGQNLRYKPLSDSDRAWLDTHIKKIKSYKLDVIAVDYMEHTKIPHSDTFIKKLQNKGLIPFISTKELDSYGRSSKNAIKREILTFINEDVIDRIQQSAHTLGALPLEYMGYIQRIQDLADPLPKIEHMHHYAGVIIWPRRAYNEPQKLLNWILQLKEIGIKVAFVHDFPFSNPAMLRQLDIDTKDFESSPHTTIKTLYSDPIIGYEVEPSLSGELGYYHLKSGEALYSAVDAQEQNTTLAAIMPWGGFAIEGASTIELINDNLWAINPFVFFQKALRLKPLIVPDVTTVNGKRLLFTHIDGDGIMNTVEWDSRLVSGDVIYKDILQKYQIPHSVSVIGGEIDDNGLFPKLAKRLQKIAIDMYALDNVEPATHTFSHPFYWDMIINDQLSEENRLKIPGYTFSLDKEIRGSLEDINKHYLPKGKKPADTVFWSGNCAPTEETLKTIYKHKILNINGGDTYITNLKPWLSFISPLGLQRGDYYQIYTGQQNENIYTNEWLGPFWGFKKVIQTFKLTNSPKRFKPIDIYYHLYSGSKKASLKALQYVFEWSISQDVMPIFTSTYIPMVMDYYTVSMAQEGETFLFDGMKSIKTLRIEKKGAGVDLKASEEILGFNHFEDHTYIHLDNAQKILLKPSQNKNYQKTPYLISANAMASTTRKRKGIHSFHFKGNVPLEITLNIPKGCIFKSSTRMQSSQKRREYTLKHKTAKEVYLDVICK